MSLIPHEWCDVVVSILENGSPNTRFVTTTARMDWMALFPESFSFEIYKVLSHILKMGSYTDARRVDTMDEPGDVYEFLFVYRTQHMYSKINLCKGKVSVLVYSAHAQRKSNIKKGRFS